MKRFLLALSGLLGLALLGIGVHGWRAGGPPSLSDLRDRLTERGARVKTGRFHIAIDLSAGTPDDERHVIFGDPSAGTYHHVQLSPRLCHWQLAPDGTQRFDVESGRKPINTLANETRLVLACYDGTVHLYAARHHLLAFPLEPGKRVCAFYSEAPAHIALQPLGDLRFDDGFMRSEIGRDDQWRVAAGAWRTHLTTLPLHDDRVPENVAASGRVFKTTPNPFVLLAAAPDDGERGLLVTGRPYWNHLRCSVAVRRLRDTGLAFVFARQDDGVCYAASVSGPAGQSVLRLERREAGKTRILRQKAFACPRWFRLGALVSATGRIEARIDGQTLLEAETSECLGGRVGLEVTGGRAIFDDVRVEDLSVPAHPLVPIKQTSTIFADKPKYPKDDRDKHLQRWASSTDLWQKATCRIAGETRTGVQNRCALFRDFRAEVPEGAKGWLALFGRGDRPLGTFAAGGRPAILERRGHGLFWQGERAALSLPGCVTVGYFPQQAAVDTRPALFSRNVWYEFFEAAPVDWLPIAGQWTIDDRWTCRRQWNWYQGVDKAVAVNFSKHRYDGDQVHELYHSMKDLFNRKYRKPGDKEGRRYARHDMNVSFCTNGRDLNSGYTLLFGGHENRATYLLKGERVLATNERAKFPPFHGIYDLHLFWFRLHIEKVGRRIRILRDDTVLFDVEDEDPLPGGHLALWTRRNGVLYAMIRSAAEARTNPGAYLAPRPAPAGGPWRAHDPDRVDCLPAADDGVKVINRYGGGPFAIALAMDEPVDLDARPVLTIPFAPGPGTKVNLHVVISDKGLVLPLTAPLEETREVLGKPRTYEPSWKAFVAEPLGAPPLVRCASCYDAKTQRIRVNLRAAFRKAYPDAGPARLESLILGNTSDQDYLLAGFGGNASGSTYRIGRPQFADKR